MVVEREGLERPHNLLIRAECFLLCGSRYPQKYPQFALQVATRRFAGSGVLPGRVGL